MTRSLLIAAAIALASSAVAAPRTPPETPPDPDFLVNNGAAKGVVTTPSGLEYFVVKSGPEADIKAGHAMALGQMPTGTIVHNVELTAGQGGKLGRAADGDSLIHTIQRGGYLFRVVDE